MAASVHLIILSEKGREKFTYIGFINVFDKCSKIDETVKFWRCEQRGRCNGRIHTRNNTVIKEVNTHSHKANAVVVEVAEVKTSLKRFMECL